MSGIFDCTARNQGTRAFFRAYSRAYFKIKSQNCCRPWCWCWRVPCWRWCWCRGCRPRQKRCVWCPSTTCSCALSVLLSQQSSLPPPCAKSSSWRPFSFLSKAQLTLALLSSLWRAKSSSWMLSILLTRLPGLTPKMSGEHLLLVVVLQLPLVVPRGRGHYGCQC